MADVLHITPAVYRKIELGYTKLSLERFFKIAEILETPFTDFLELKEDALMQRNHDNVNQQKIANLYKETMEKLIDSYEERLREKDEYTSVLKSFTKQ